MSGERSVKTINRQTEQHHRRENRVAEVPTRNICRNRVVKGEKEKDVKRNGGEQSETGDANDIDNANQSRCEPKQPV